jgi:hypothetical protein
MKKIIWGGTVFVLSLACTPRAGAITIAAQLCNGADFFCNAGGDVIIDSGIRTNGVGILPGNTRSILGFTFTDALVTFSGTMVSADSAGKFIYLWGSGAATAQAGAAGDYLDVAISQTYVTTPGFWNWSEIDVGTCDANAKAAASTSLVQGIVNGTTLPVLGNNGDCAAAPFSFGAGPVVLPTGVATNLVAVAQFHFAAGNFPQTITLPWGDDFPDITLNFSDPNNPQNFITNTDVPGGFAELDNGPEPGTFGLIAGALAGLTWFARRRRA